MSFLDKISNFYYKNRKNILYVLMFLFIFTVFTDLSFASGNGGNWTTTVSSAWVEQAGKTESNIFFDALNWIGKIIWAILWMLTFLVWLFLYPAWTNWSFIGLVDPLKTMWIMVSNIVYFIFAFIFIWIAFMNIIWKEDSYQLKQAIPKFIIWVLIVPFSWFFVQFIISLSWILTVWVLSLPYDTFKWTEFFSKISDIEVWCKDTIIDKNDMKCKENNSKIKLDKLINAENSESLFWIVAFYTYGVMWVENSQKLFEKDVKSFNNLVDLWVKVIIDIIFIIIYLLLMIALFLALFVRWVMLWIFAMFSPVFWLLFFFWKTSEWIWEWTKNFNIKQFIALAFVPVYVAWALAFWLVFIFIAWHWLTIGEKNNVTTILKIEENWNKISFWDLWSVTWSWSNSDSAIRQTGKLIAWFQWTIWTMVLQVFWLWILWMAVMAALKSSEITKAAVEPISSFGNSVWELIKKAPTYAPIIPWPGGSMMSVSWLSQAWSNVTTAMQQASRWSWDAIEKAAKKAFGLIDNDASLISKRAKEKWDLSWNNDLLRKDFNEVLWKFDYVKAKEDSNLRSQIIDYHKKVHWIEVAASDFNRIEDLAKKIWNSWKFQWAWLSNDFTSAWSLSDKLKNTAWNSMWWEWWSSSWWWDQSNWVTRANEESIRRANASNKEVQVNANRNIKVDNNNNLVTVIENWSSDTAKSIKLNWSEVTKLLDVSNNEDLVKKDRELLKKLLDELDLDADPNKWKELLRKIYGDSIDVNGLWERIFSN